MKRILKIHLYILVLLLAFFSAAACCPVAVSAKAAPVPFAKSDTLVTVTKLEEGLSINIRGWRPYYKYQIWSYQKMASDCLLGKSSGYSVDQWILSQAYIFGSMGELQPDGSISFVIGDFVPPGKNHMVSVRVIDSDNRFAGEVTNSYSPSDMQVVKITKVFVDGSDSRGITTKEIKKGALINFKIESNNVDRTVYKAVLKENGMYLLYGDKNNFSWDISKYTSGSYTVQILASNGTTTDTRDIRFRLFSNDSENEYKINNMNILLETEQGMPRGFEIDPDFDRGYFYYNLSERGRAPIYTSGLYGLKQTIKNSVNYYGIYQINGYLRKNTAGSSAYEDIFTQTVTVSRNPTEPFTASLHSNIYPGNSVPRFKTLRFTADFTIPGIGQTPVEYSFWRDGANGFVLVKDWSSDNTLEWSPGIAGRYTIEARAKGKDAGSYEACKSMTFLVTD